MKRVLTFLVPSLYAFGLPAFGQKPIVDRGAPRDRSIPFHMLRFRLWQALNKIKVGEFREYLEFATDPVTAHHRNPVG
jgi:hypothetical protein